MLAVLGGSFDPIHNGHLRIAQALTEQFAVSEIRFIPCKQPVIDKQLVATIQARLTMLQRAVEPQHPGWVIDERELKRAAPSWTLETLRSLRSEFPTRALSFVLGSDVLLDLPQWENWQQLCEYAHLVVIHRPSPIETSPSDALKAFIQQRRATDFDCLRKTPAGFLYQADIQVLPISSTAIRQAIATGETPTALLPEAVLAYIKEKRLYRNAPLS